MDSDLEASLRKIAPDKARRLVSELLIASLRQQPHEVRTLLDFSEHDVEEGHVTVGDDAVTAMDDKYFSAAERGDSEQAGHLFSAARLLAAAFYLQMKGDPDAMCEAAYEALAAGPRPY